MKLALVLLTRNERPGLEKVFDRIPVAHFEEAFAVDGGSTDGTLELYRSRKFRVLTQRLAGRGEAIHFAFGQAQADGVVLFSPDGNEDPADLPRFRPMLEAGCDLVIATRMGAGASNEEDAAAVPIRKWANQALGLLANWTWNRGPFVSDTINGYRAITKHAWRRLAPDATGYVMEYQTSIRAMKLGFRIGEFPTHEGARIGPGGSPSVSTGLQHLSVYFRELRLGRRFA